MKNIREIRSEIETAEKTLESIPKMAKDKRKAAWVTVQQNIANARALTNMAPVSSKDETKTADRHFVRRAVLELVERVESDAAKIDF